MDPIKALEVRLEELLIGEDYADFAHVAEMLYAALNRSGWKLVRYTDHDRLNQEAAAALELEMGVG
jgi:hypothetical protein